MIMEMMIKYLLKNMMNMMMSRLPGAGMGPEAERGTTPTRDWWATTTTTTTTTTMMRRQNVIVYIFILLAAT
jgi:hypothetical protein